MSRLYDHTTALLRWLPPETAHNLTLWGLAHGLGPRVSPVRSDALKTELWGIEFPNPLGIAAGFDKNGVAIDGALRLGVGFVEIGGVTPRPQPGNVKPRMFRLPEDGALINRMGFNNAGAAAIAARLDARQRTGIAGVNMAANADSREPIADFIQLTETFAPRADFLTADISCPNTENGQVFLEPHALRDLLNALTPLSSATPLLIKLSPDIENSRLQSLMEVILSADVAGLIVCNTTRSRPSTLHSAHRAEAGGLSGQPLAPLALDMLRRCYEYANGRLPLISVGGIASVNDAYARICAGASLLQVYTGLVYCGPSLIAQLCEGLATRLAADGYTNIKEAIGSEHLARAKPSAAQ